MDELFSLDDFSGIARLFPLPHLVMFPSVLQPLHVFEPRYREMMQDALDDDNLLTMALLKPTTQVEAIEPLPIYPMTCVGRIIQEERLPDGRYNLLLQGVSRARIVKEHVTTKLYRSADVDLVEDQIDFSETERPVLRQQLLERIPQWFATQGASMEQIGKLLHSNLSLGTLCDIFSFALPLDLRVKQRLLDEPRIKARVELLLGQLPKPDKPDILTNKDAKFPPDFSEN